MDRKELFVKFKEPVVNSLNGILKRQFNVHASVGLGMNTNNQLDYSFTVVGAQLKDEAKIKLTIEKITAQIVPQSKPCVNFTNQPRTF